MYTSVPRGVHVARWSRRAPVGGALRLSRLHISRQAWCYPGRACRQPLTARDTALHDRYSPGPGKARAESRCVACNSLATFNLTD